jgi:AP-3 complex subunit mu
MCVLNAYVPQDRVAKRWQIALYKTADPAVAFSYLYSLLGVLKQYLGGEVTENSLRESFDTVLQLFSETFSAPYPISTDASALQELVPSTSLLAKMFSAGLAVASATASKGLQGGAAAGAANAQHLRGGVAGEVVNPFSSPLHWRRAGIRHAQNEVYFDVREEIQAVLDKNGNVITGNVWGRIDCRSKLSGGSTVC